MSQISSNKALNSIVPGWVRPNLLTESDHSSKLAGTFSLRQTLGEPKEERESVGEKDSGW